MNKIGIGIIGCGGRIQYLLNIMPEMGKRIEIVAATDPRPAMVETIRRKFNPALRAYDDYRDLLKDPAVDWVMIGSWNCFHREQTVAAFRAGKHVYSEKPLATTLADCAAMRKAHRESGKLFAIGFTLRYSPHYAAIKKLIQKGTIGKIVSFEFNETLDFNHGGYIHSDWRRLTRNAGTHLLEKCCHDIDLANWMVDSIAMRAASFGGLNFFRPENARHMKRLGKTPDGRRRLLRLAVGHWA